MNAINQGEFKCKTRFGFDEIDHGITLNFLHDFIKTFGNQTMGMSISSVNFDIDS